MESWVVSAISVLVGVLVLAISLKNIEFYIFTVVGVIIISMGLFTCLFKFWKWLEDIQK